MMVTVTGALRLVPLMVTLSPVTPLVGMTDVMVGRSVLDTVSAPADVTASPSVVTTTSTVRTEITVKAIDLIHVHVYNSRELFAS